MYLQLLLSALFWIIAVSALFIWGLAVYLGMQLSRYRPNPEAAHAKRRWLVAMPVSGPGRGERWIGICCRVAGAAFTTLPPYCSV
jgi:hypothetical protein